MRLKREGLKLWWITVIYNCIFKKKCTFEWNVRNVGIFLFRYKSKFKKKQNKKNKACVTLHLGIPDTDTGRCCHDSQRTEAAKKQWYFSDSSSFHFVGRLEAAVQVLTRRERPCWESPELMTQQASRIWRRHGLHLKSGCTDFEHVDFLMSIKSMSSGQVWAFAFLILWFDSSQTCFYESPVSHRNTALSNFRFDEKAISATASDTVNILW